jgi:hypothetical protein
MTKKKNSAVLKAVFKTLGLALMVLTVLAGWEFDLGVLGVLGEWRSDFAAFTLKGRVVVDLVGAAILWPLFLLGLVLTIRPTA